jgi:hypothetical protein
MKNNLLDLNDHLFAAMERLSDESMSGDELEKEIKRAHASAKIAQSIVSNASLALKAQQLHDDGYVRNLPKQLMNKRD